LIEFLVARHAELTGSPRAKWILDNWETMLPKFVKVFPHEYKRVLAVSSAPATVAPTFGSTPARADPAALKVGATSVGAGLSAGATPETREALRG
jgi:hypothetical protein